VWISADESGSLMAHVSDMTQSCVIRLVHIYIYLVAHDACVGKYVRKIHSYVTWLIDMRDVCGVLRSLGREWHQ